LSDVQQTISTDGHGLDTSGTCLVRPSRTCLCNGLPAKKVLPLNTSEPRKSCDKTGLFCHLYCELTISSCDDQLCRPLRGASDRSNTEHKILGGASVIEQKGHCHQWSRYIG